MIRPIVALLVTLVLSLGVALSMVGAADQPTSPAAAETAASGAKESAALPKATIDGTGPGWNKLVEADFINVNCDPETWSWKDGVLHTTGKPIGVLQYKKKLTNFEFVLQWRHLTVGGNSGVYVWASEESLKKIKPG